MSYEFFTFIHYIVNYSSDHIRTFLRLFKDDVEHIPNRMISSKALRHYIKIDSYEKEQSFQRVFMEYYRKKLLL